MTEILTERGRVLELINFNREVAATLNTLDGVRGLLDDLRDDVENGVRLLPLPTDSETTNVAADQ